MPHTPADAGFQPDNQVMCPDRGNLLCGLLSMPVNLKVKTMTRMPTVHLLTSHQSSKETMSEIYFRMMSCL